MKTAYISKITFHPPHFPLKSYNFTHLKTRKENFEKPYVDVFSEQSEAVYSMIREALSQ